MMMNAGALTNGLFSLQLPVSVYESVIDIISGEVLFLKIHNLQIYFKYYCNNSSSEPFSDIGLINLHVFLQATMLFAELTYTLATEEAERIGVDHVARMTATGTGENSTGKMSALSH